MALCNSFAKIVKTRDSSTKGLVQTRIGSNKKFQVNRIVYASRSSMVTERTHAKSILNLLAVVCSLKYFRLYKHGKPVNLSTGHKYSHRYSQSEKKASEKTSAKLTGLLYSLAQFRNATAIAADKKQTEKTT